MEIYLVIITTVLVLTQIVRLIQNAMSLKELHEVHSYNDEIMRIYKKIEKVTDIYMQGETAPLICKNCICNECNENELSEKGGQCGLCNICEDADEAKVVCPINKYHVDYGKGQGNSFI